MAVKKSVFKVFIGGGGDDWISHIVETYAGDYAALNPDLEVRYFSWTESIDIANHLFAIPQAAHVTIVGHSYGADTAFSVMKNARTIDVLISIDPVGRFKVPWSTRRARC